MCRSLGTQVRRGRHRFRPEILGTGHVLGGHRLLPQVAAKLIRAANAPLLQTIPLDTAWPRRPPDPCRAATPFDACRRRGRAPLPESWLPPLSFLRLLLPQTSDLGLTTSASDGSL